MGRAYGRVISDYSSEALKEIFENHISKENAQVRKGKKFPEMHILIMNFKSWIRSIYHKCSQKHMQAYLNEFFYRFNRRGFGETMFHNLIVRMINSVTLYHKAFTT